MPATLCSLPGICDVEYVRGAAAEPNAPPDLFFEVAHGATRAHHFDELRRELRGSYGDGLRDFYFVNTDVGAPELARAVAERVVKNQPRRTALLVRCRLPRTFVDCNRRIERDSGPQEHRPGQMTPGMPPWVQERADQQLLLDRYYAYRDVVTAAFASVRPEGFTLFVHTYAPRSIDVTVDADIGARLREAYAPGKLGSWPLRPAVDLITHDPDGRELAAPGLARAAQAEFTAAGFEVARNSTYALHPITLAHGFASERPLGTLCLEVRRDLLVREFVPFVELLPEAERVARAALPLATAIGSQLA